MCFSVHWSLLVHFFLHTFGEKAYSELWIETWRSWNCGDVLFYIFPSRAPPLIIILNHRWEITPNIFYFATLLKLKRQKRSPQPWQMQDLVTEWDFSWVTFCGWCFVTQMCLPHGETLLLINAHPPPQINKTTWQTVVLLCIHLSWFFIISKDQDPGCFPLLWWKEKKKKVRIQFTYFGNLNMGQFVVTQSGLLIPEGSVAANGAVKFPGEDTIESGSA